MPPDPLILGFDTSAAHCAAVLSEGARPLAEAFEEMGRGQAERLFPMLDALLEGAGKRYADLDGVAVGVGPGNFTGIRISVSAARGLAMGLRIPAVPVSGFELMRGTEGLTDLSPMLVSLPGARGQAYIQRFEGARPVSAPDHVDPGAMDAPGAGVVVLGFAASVLAGATGAVAREAVMKDIPARLAAIGAAKIAAGESGPPAPLYVRPADATPPADPPPVILDDA